MLDDRRERDGRVGFETDQPPAGIGPSGTENDQFRDEMPDARSAEELERAAQRPDSVHDPVARGRARSADQRDGIAGQERGRRLGPSASSAVQKQDAGGGHTRSSLPECGLRSGSAGYLSSHPPNGRSIESTGPFPLSYFQWTLCVFLRQLTSVFSFFLVLAIITGFGNRQSRKPQRTCLSGTR